jgi:hypothetical protein
VKIAELILCLPKANSAGEGKLAEKPNLKKRKEQTERTSA